MSKKPYNYEANELLMGEWQAAYRAYNGKAAPPIHYDMGWFKIQGGGIYRRAKLTEMAATLRRRVAEREVKHEDHLLNGSAHQGSEPGQSS